MTPVMFPPGPSEAFDKARTHGISPCCHNDWDRRCRLLDRGNHWIATRDDDVDVELNEFRREIGEPLLLAPGEPPLDNDISPLDVAKLAEPVFKRLGEGRLLLWRSSLDVADPVHLSTRLGVGSERREK